MITRAHATPLMGQHVVLRTHDGAVHHGYLHSITNDGLYLRPINGRTRLASAGESYQAEQLQNAIDGQVDAEQTWFPFFFFPFFALALLGPWAWWW